MPGPPAQPGSPVPAGVRRLLGDSAVRGALRFAVTLAVANIVLLAVFGSVSAAVLGSFAVAIHLYFLDFDGGLRDRVIGHSTATGIGIVAVTLGTLMAQPLWLAALSAAVVSSVFAFARVLRGYVARSTVGLQGAFFLPLMIPATPSELPSLLGGWLIGSVLAIIAACILLPHRRAGITRDAVADWLSAAAGLARAVGQHTPIDAERERLRQAHDALVVAAARGLGRPGILGGRERAVDEIVARAHWSMPVAQMVEPAPLDDDPTLALTSATAFAQAADIVRTSGWSGTPADIEAERTRDLHRQSGRSASELTAHYPTRVMSIAASTQLWLAGASRGLSLPAPSVGSIADESPRAVIRQAARLDSVWSRNALRTGLVTAASVLLVRELGVEHGLWVVLVALSCIQGSFSGSGAARNMVQMSAGAVLGVVVAGTMLALHPPYAVFAVLLPVSAFIAKLVAARGPFIAQFAYTPFALVNVAVLSWPTAPGLVTVRVEDVALGAALAVIASLAVFPFGLSGLLGNQAKVMREQSVAYLAAAIAAARGEAPLSSNDRQVCTRSTTAFESTLAAAYLRPTADPIFLNYEQDDAFARDRLVGGDACADLAARRIAGDTTPVVAQVYASWWQTHLPADQAAGAPTG